MDLASQFIRFLSPQRDQFTTFLGHAEKPPFDEQMEPNPAEASGSQCWIVALGLVESRRLERPTGGWGRSAGTSAWMFEGV